MGDFQIEDSVLINYTGKGGDVRIPNGISKIANNAFSKYTVHTTKQYDAREAISSVIIPEGVVSIGERAFKGCSNLKTIEIPRSIEEIGSEAFKDTAWLTEQKDEFVKLHNILIRYQGCESKVTIPDGIVSVAGGAFASNDLITEVLFPESVTNIDQEAFYNCKGLTHLEIPKSVKRIGENAFYGTKWLIDKQETIVINGIVYKYIDNDNKSEVTIPEDINIIGPYAFAYNDSITKVLLGKSVKKIEEGAFLGCHNLKSITFEEGLVEIGAEAFSYCKNLEKVVFPYSLKSIGEKAFYGNKNLVLISNICNGLTIGKKAFQDCDKLYKKGYLIVGDTLYGYKGIDGNLNIPNEIKRIDKDAIKDNVYIKSVSVAPNLFEDIWKMLNSKSKLAVSIEALQNKQLNNLIKTHLKKNKDLVFAKACTDDDAVLTEHLISLVEPLDESVVDKWIDQAQKRINVKAYLMNYKGNKYSTVETEETLLDNIEKELGYKERTLEDWKKLYKFSIKKENVGISAYLGNDSIVEIPSHIGGYPVTRIANNAFKNNEKLKQVILPETLEIIGQNAFKKCISIMHLSVPAGVRSIEKGAFEECLNLIDCIFADNSQLQNLGENAFKKCVSLKCISIPKEVKFIGYACFEECRSLSLCKFDVDSHTEGISGNVFKNCISLKQITLPQKIDRICNGLFDGCKGLTSVYIPESVSFLGEYAFRDCKAMSTITLSQNLKEIMQGAFTTCTNLSEVLIPEGVERIDIFAFRGCSRLMHASIPVSVTEIGTYNDEVFNPIYGINPFYGNPFSDCKKVKLIVEKGSIAEEYAKLTSIPYIYREEYEK